MTFWDSSAVVPLLIEQPKTALAELHLRADPRMVVWWGSRVECVSALRRLWREGAIAPADVEFGLGSLQLLAGRWIEIVPHHEVRQLAERLLAQYPLRAADSLQLAAALAWVGRIAGAAVFATFDGRLMNAAQREGFALPAGEWAAP